MRSAILAGLFYAAVTGAPDLGAQEAPNVAGVSPSVELVHADSAPITVRVSSRKLPFEVADLMLLNCNWMAGPENMVALMWPWMCTRRVTGALDRVSADSVAFVRHGHPIRLASRDVKSLEMRNGRSRNRTIAWAALGALEGLAATVMIGASGALTSGASAVTTASVLTFGGAAIGGYRGGQRWTEVPRSFAVPAPPNR